MVQVKNLNLPLPVLAPNVWNQVKEQPASVTVSVFFQEGFTSASGEDDLSKSIHYGALAKRIRAVCAVESLSLVETLRVVEDTVFLMGNRPDGPNVISSVVSELHLPKASMTGDEITFTWITKVGRTARGGIEVVRKLFTIPDMRLMTVIGMNPHEREAKQPVIATLELDYVAVNGAQPDQTPFPEGEALSIERSLAKVSLLSCIVHWFKMQTDVVQFIEESRYETLELLAQHAIRLLSEDFWSKGYGSPTVRLRLEKPKAIVFADAAVVELFVPARDSTTASSPIPNGAPSAVS